MTHTTFQAIQTPIRSISLVIASLVFVALSGAAILGVCGRSTMNLSVQFIGMTNITAADASMQIIWITNSTAGQTLPIPVSGEGATGRCALFWVTNITAHHIWFQTTSVEQKTETGWQAFIPSHRSWSGVGGSQWLPRSGRVQAVGWPPGLPTNASWRLRVRYGRDPSLLGMMINQKAGRVIFHSGTARTLIASSEVKQ